MTRGISAAAAARHGVAHGGESKDEAQRSCLKPQVLRALRQAGA